MTDTQVVIMLMDANARGTYVNGWPLLSRADEQRKLTERAYVAAMASK